MKKHTYVYQFLKFIKLYFLSTLILIFFMSCTNKTNVLKKDIKEIAKEIMISAKNCALITVDSLGIANVRTMDPFLPEANLTVWFGTNAHSLKVKQIRKNKNVSLYYFDKETVSYVTLQGVASIVNTDKDKNNFWKSDWENFYKNRETDYILIKFVPKKANVVSEQYQLLGDSITWKTPQINFKHE